MLHIMAYAMTACWRNAGAVQAGATWVFGVSPGSELPSAPTTWNSENRVQLSFGSTEFSFLLFFL